MKYDGILFDLDGTLWDATGQIAASWNDIIAEAKEVLAPYGKGTLLTAADLRAVCGKTMDAITEMLFGDYPEKEQLAERCYSHENDYLAEHPGTIYPGIEEALAILADQVPLYVVSNCQSGYIEVFLKTSGLSGYFSDHLSFGDTGRPKGDNIRLMCERHGLKSPLYVGDTQGDADASAAAGVPFAHVRYGFGTVSEAVLFIDTPEELASII